MRFFKAAICQNKPSRIKSTSLTDAAYMIAEAADNGAEIVLLPEIFYHPYELKAISSIAEADKSSLAFLQETARKNKVFICSGTMAEIQGDRRYNKSYLLSPSGDLLHEYSKCHMFDVNFKGLRVKESSFFEKGSDIGVVKTPLATIGILVSDHIRFPEMARKLALMGAEMILVPAAFNTVTGPAHWDILFRARAIENQLYVAAASPARDNKAAYKAYGHSMFIDPWGTVLSKAGLHKNIIYADIDPSVISDVRGRMPLLELRRPDIY